MIQAILLILKIIGITMLVILGLLLLILALVLFVPIFYRVRVIHSPEKTEVKARVSFLFPLLLATVQYLKKAVEAVQDSPKKSPLTYKVRIFGAALLDSERPKKKKKEKKPKEKKAGKGKASEGLEAGQAGGNPEEDALGQTGALELLGTESTVMGQESNDASVGHDTVPADGVEQDSQVSGNAEQTVQASETEEQPKVGFFEKIRLKIQKIRETITKVIAKIKKLLHQKDEVLRILGEPSSKQAIAHTWDKVKRLFKHILPRKIKGYVKFGADNPATTGQVTGIISVLYAKTGYVLDFQPNFTEKELECDVELRGHIQVFTLLVIVLKVVLNKEFRRLLKRFQQVKDIE